jgi:glycosyltransferase involved in cell wall biosynthesis
MPLAEQRGGAEALLAELLEHTAETGLTWSLVFFEDGALVERARSLGLESSVIRTGRLREIHRLGNAIVGISRLAQEADVVLSWMPKAHLYGGPASLLARRPSVWFQHGIPSARSAFDRLITLVPASGVVVPSRNVAAAQARLRPLRRTRVVHPSVDLERFRPDVGGSAPQTAGFLGDRRDPVIGIVARLQRWKGVHLVIEALPIVQRSHPAVLLVIVGGSHFSEPDYERQLQRRADELGVAGSVFFAGLQHDVLPWIAAMDVVVHASYDEPFGISILEAMAMAKPVVASDSGGPLEIIQNGENGVLFRTGDPSSLAVSVSAVLSDPGFATRLGCGARRRAEAFSSTRFVADFERALKELVEPMLDQEGG